MLFKAWNAVQKSPASHPEIPQSIVVMGAVAGVYLIIYHLSSVSSKMQS